MFQQPSDPFLKNVSPELQRRCNGPLLHLLTCRVARSPVRANTRAADLLKAGKMKVPDYAFDCHTLRGKRTGMTKADFFREKQKALKPRQPGLFDDLPGC